MDLDVLKILVESCADVPAGCAEDGAGRSPHVLALNVPQHQDTRTLACIAVRTVEFC